MTMTRHVQGYILIDAMIAMVILVFGVLGLLNLQARLTIDNQLAQLRTQASFYGHTTVVCSWSGCSQRYLLCRSDSRRMRQWDSTNLYNQLAHFSQYTMPSANLNPPTATLNADGTMTVTIFWRLNQETVFHRYIVRSQIQ